MHPTHLPLKGSCRLKWGGRGLWMDVGIQGLPKIQDLLNHQNMDNKQLIQKKIWLNEVSFMRPILLVLLVSYHSFAPYVGAWEKPEGIDDVNIYKVIGLLSRAFRLEGFVFISGYIFTFQLIEKKKFNTFGSLLKSKFLRLLIPGFVFSALYVGLFLDITNIIPFVLKVVNGAGHLWYLPCLFWLFLVQYVIVKRGWTLKQLAMPLVLAVILSVEPLPLPLDRSLYFCMFFTGGGIFWMYSGQLSKNGNLRKVMCSWLIFGLLFLIMNVIIRHFTIIANHTEGIQAYSSLAVKSLSKAVLAWSGIYALYLTAVLYCKNNALSQAIIKVGACGYGVYVFHQFILVFLYRHTELPQFVGTYWFPWIGLVTTVFISTALTLAVRSTKIGKKYL